MPTMSAADDALISTFGRLVEAHSALGRQLGRSLERECGISHSSFEALLRISRSEGGQISMSALAQQVALTSGGITRLLDRLIEADYVTRVPCPADRRVQFAALTAAGKLKLAQAADVHARNLHQVFNGFSKRDLETLDKLLDKLRGPGLDDGDPND
jgi:MarR family transcriptional regulator, 2-MHQ and catechol-resistance regulon repressor